MDRETYMAQYRAEHRHPVNKALHNVGIPLIAISLVLLPFRWKLGLGLFVGAWALQFLGHAIEGNRPAILGGRGKLKFSLWPFFVAPYWLLTDALQRLRRKRV